MNQSNVTTMAGENSGKVKSFWESRVVREIRNVKVSFYRRYAGGDFVADFSLFKRRTQKSTHTFNVTEATRVAMGWIQEQQEERNGIGAMKRAEARERRPISTVAEVLAALRAENGVKLWGGETVRTYASSLLRLARVVNPRDTEGLRLDKVLTKEVMERFYAQGQGLAAVDWSAEMFDEDEMPVNGGLNTCMRNVKSLFSPEACERKWDAEVKLPPLDDLRKLRYLHAPVHGFEPWPPDVYAAMCAASEAMREQQPELWLVNAMLRRLGLRVGELLAARREWIEEHNGEAWLVVKQRKGEFRLFKKGAARKLTLDPEMKEILLQRTGFLIGEGLPPTARRELVEREHSAFLRQFIPTRRKTNHELRMYAASLIYQRERQAGRDGLAAAAYFLGDSIQTTKDYYAAWLGGSAVLDAAAVAA